MLIRLRIWPCCGTAGWAGCSPGCGRRRRWARSCARSGSVTSASSTRSRSRFLTGLTRHAPLISTGADVTFVDIDDTVRQTYGYAKQGAGYGYTGVKGLNALLATASTASSAPVIVATRLRKGSANSARGAARLVADALVTTRSCGVTGMVVLRADSAFYGRDVIAAARRAGARFSITARKDRPSPRRSARSPTTRGRRSATRKRCSTKQLQQWVSDAEVAEIRFTAFTSRRKARAGHGPVDRPPGPRRQPRPHGRRTRRASCSGSGGTTPCSPIHPGRC